MDNGESLSDFFEESESCDDIFSILEAMESASHGNNNNNNNNITATALAGLKDREISNERFEFQKSPAAFDYSTLSAFLESEAEIEAASPSCKRQKLVTVGTASASQMEEEEEEEGKEGQPRISHITVERNRRKQMNENLSVLRSLMPCFYVKRGDQASIIGGVITYINELQVVLQSLEAKKQRKAYTDVLSPRKPPLSPRLSLSVSPRSPQPNRPRLQRNPQTGFLSRTSLPNPAELSPCHSSTSSINDMVNELVASSRSAVAEVEVKFCGPNLLLRTVSRRIPGQVVKIVTALVELELEILEVNTNMVDEKVVNSFTIKVGIECQLSAEELAQVIQQTFC